MKGTPAPIIFDKGGGGVVKIISWGSEGINTEHERNASSTTSEKS